ncbi:hypothetical protein P691DRAFT_770412 [Macrolepiota fuliginosa MF-IS2]|uniref:Phorbol-ester/DAG-type domain-containing protein n=1 Tax=Macrolepiota fuliginosa MF-IS2 TaxID=1400762 RepID=A0A9P5XPF1_9AGAR|nr:hypothetical protein P691DRAFT_770412 [Macrolepiota fuliginosa MF-IS2]
MNLGRPHLPPIETDYSELPSQVLRFSLDTTSPFTPVSSQAPEIPSFRLSTSTNDATTQNETLRPAPSNRARDEARKLLAHVLTQLRNRMMPPSVSDAVGTFHEDIEHSWNFKAAVRAQMGRLDLGQHGNEDLDVERQGYSTDATFSLMIQLQEILVMTLEQRWDIFADNGSSQNPLMSSDNSNKLSSSPFRRSRSSFYNSGRKSRSPSPSRKNQVFVSELLALCISILASVVAEDCRYQTASPRPLCPPNALQAVTLNVAQVLLHINTHNSRIISQIALALIPAFSTFEKTMYPRIISFFDLGIIKNSLSNLRRLQGFETSLGVGDDPVNYPFVSIHVDEATEDKVQDNDNPAWHPWSSTTKSLKIQSTNAPAQPMSIYHLSSIVPPLLGCALDNIEMEAQGEKDFRTRQVLQVLLKTIVDMKVDAYSDMLQVIAYHTPKARKFSATLLLSFWPRSVGHVIISEPPINWFSQPSGNLLHQHQFTPWQFRHRHNWFSPGDSSQHDCSVCKKTIHGFGLLCPYCTCTVHFDCYDHPGGSAIVQYSNASDPHVQRVAMFRFSKTRPELPPLRGTMPANGLPHQFHPINLFTLSLCFMCQQPLWGCASQGFQCGSCSQFVHPHCLGRAITIPCGSTMIDSGKLTVQFPSLRQSCFEKYRDILQLSHQELARKTYEEISIFRDVLLTQVHILKHGLALGTILVTHQGKNIDHEHQTIPEFELHRTLKWCEELLDNLYASPAVEEYLQENGLLRRDYSMLYTWSSLVYVAASMKSPSAALGPSNSTSSDFLNVTPIDVPGVETEVSHPFDMVSLSRMRDVLGHEFHIHSDAAAYVLLSHLHQLAFFVSKDEDIFSDLATMQKNKTQSCSFPLPLGLDLSIDVETLVSAIEACLSDIDLFVNEFGFLLLVRRMWPDGLMSDYGLKRLARGVFTWIINEDSQLAIILRDYLGKNKPLPGMASNLMNQWPPVHHERPVHGGSMQNGGDYLASRQALLHRYAGRWLLALHNQDVDLYAGSLFSACDELADHGAETNTRSLSYHMLTAEDDLMQFERILHHILRLSQARVLFSVSDTIYLRWLELVHNSGILQKDVSSSALLRSFPRGSDHRTTTMIISATGESLDRSVGLETDPWQVITDITQESQAGLKKALCWLNLLSRSGLEVPLDVYKQFISALKAMNNPLNESCLFIKTILASLWLRSLGRLQYQPLIASFHYSLVPGIHSALKETSTRSMALSAIKQTFASCLLLYGCERSQLLSCGLVEDDVVSTLPSRRKLARETALMEPVFIDPAIMKSIELHLKVQYEDVTSMIAKFLHTFFTSSSFIETHEMDNFVLKNERLFSKCAWQFYGVQRQEVVKLRTPILLRVLSVDPEEFQHLVEQMLSNHQEWEARVHSATRMFRIVQDVCSPAFNVDGRQWKTSMVRVFLVFFSLLWLDPKEEVRLVVKTHCSSLLPSHFEALASCFDETMTRAPISDRVRLISFLSRLRVHFSRWRVLSWNAVLEVLSENSVYDQHVYADTSTMRNDGPIAAADPELAQLNVSLVALALDMLSDGVDADSLTIIKIKAQLVRILGSQNVSLVPAGANGRSFHLAYGEIKSIPEIAYPCFRGLVSLLDSWHKVELPSPIINTNSHDDDKEVDVLVGTAYADIPLNLLATYERIFELPVLIIKHLLEAVHVIIYKHDFENRNLNVFSTQSLRRAVAKTLDILEANVPYEIRQVAFSVIQAFFRKSMTLTGSLILNVAERILKLTATRIDKSVQDSLTEQGCSFVGDTFEKYCKSGLFISLLKRPLQREFFITLKHALGCSKGSSSILNDNLLWDALLRLNETEVNSLQNLLYNLQHFVDLVHHERYSTDMMGLVGKQLTHLAQRMSDGSGSSVDASPLFNILATLLQHNRANSKDLLPYLDTLLRVTLTRLQVDNKSVSLLLVVTNGLRRKNQPLDPTSISSNIVPTVFEILGDGLRLKTRLLASTLKSILEALLTAEFSPAVTPVISHPQLFVDLVDDGYHWLDNYHWVEGQTEQDFYASLVVARMVFQAMSYDASVLQRLSLDSERSARPHLRSMRAWNILAIAALSDNANNFWVTQLFKQLKSFSTMYFSALWPYMKSPGSVPDSATADINQAYLAIKLWLVIARQSEEAHQVGELVYSSVWNELWPPFESIVNVLETEAQTGVSPIMAGFIASSITDLFVFVKALRIPLSLQKSERETVLKRLQSLVRGESVLIKINRAIEGMAETQPETPLAILLDQAAKDLIATEKLRLLEKKREPVRATGDRRANVEKKMTADRLNWKDVRLHT